VETFDSYHWKLTALVDGEARVPDPVEFASRHPSSVGDRTPPSGKRRTRDKVPAVVNHGRWVVRCPTPGCGGAELAREDGLFFCCECRNAEVGGDYRTVVFPGERRELEQALAAKQVPARNWDGEPLEEIGRPEGIEPPEEVM
jgi:hypothetical protein